MKRVFGALHGVLGIRSIIPATFAALLGLSSALAYTLPVRAATPTASDVQTAELKAVAFLDTQQNADGSFGHSFPVAETSFALVSYGVVDGGNISTLSAARQTIVKNAAAWLLGQQDTTPTDQAYGTFREPFTYDTGLALTALSFSANANPGIPTAITAGRQGLVDLFQGAPSISCSTADGSGTDSFCGGWNYDFGFGRSDESNTGFAMTGLKLTGGVPAAIAAADVDWQRHIQALIATNPTWSGSHNDGGGSYQPFQVGCLSCNFSSNANDTGSMLFGYGFDGVPGTDPKVQAGLTLAQDVLNVYEMTKSVRNGVFHFGPNEDGACVPGSGCDWGFQGGEGGYHYSLWSLSKGLGEYIAPNLSDPTNWYAKVADLLVSQQNADGSWPVDGRDDATPIVATGFGVFAVGLAATPPPPVTNFTAAPGCGTIHLSWTNPSAPNYGGLMIRRRTDTFPTSPTNGTLVATVNAPGTSFDDTVPIGTTIFYGAFPYDTTGQLFGPESTATATSVCFPAPGISFVIGNGNATIGSAVTYWGAQWSLVNLLSAGSAPSSFKGFANTTAGTPACGTSWTSDPANSAMPPASVPPVMAVIVSSSISQSGSTISGDVAHIVVVNTASGYLPDPGHAGTGTVVSVVC